MGVWKIISGNLSVFLKTGFSYKSFLIAESCFHLHNMVDSVFHLHNIGDRALSDK